MSETSRGNRYIITATDYFSKWPEAVAVANKRSEGVGEFLYTIFCRHGWPEQIISDQGREFVNDGNKIVEKLQTDRRNLLFSYNYRKLLDIVKVRHNISSPYHPQTNGLDERMNQTLIRILAKLAKVKEEWDLYIDSALYAYRVSRQDSTKYTPFFLMYNRNPTLLAHNLICQTE